VHEGFWLGCMTAADLNAVTARFYETSQWYQSSEYNRSGLFDWEQVAVKQYFRAGSRILVAAAGAGREILALHREGFLVEGFECNPDLLRLSRSVLTQNGAPNLVVSSRANEVPPGSQNANGLIVGWGAYTHIPGKHRRIRFLELLRQRAVANAPILLSFLTRDGASNYDALTRQCARLSGVFSRTSNGYTVEAGDHLSCDGFRHLFLRSEVESELKQAGFEPIMFSEEGYCHVVGTAVG
jgi:hypothetical protein